MTKQERSTFPGKALERQARGQAPRSCLRLLRLDLRHELVQHALHVVDPGRGSPLVTPDWLAHDCPVWTRELL